MMCSLGAVLLAGRLPGLVVLWSGSVELEPDLDPFNFM